ncbi:uncharacterized protein L203_104253 [Cryptococcus depauperatus CBS 7841]|uniref:Small-subunit processome Utp12 domain-containing protein n=1 Tax=Cryptococcus depauperatus CBS 7841 TaxID=1295531 RepID=A0AAJ8JVB7_9TREE
MLLLSLGAFVHHIMAPHQPVAGPSKPKHANQPVASLSLPPPTLSSFNSSRTLFALASPVLGRADKVQIWDIASNRVTSEWELPAASKATTLIWTSIPTDISSKKKKRRKSGAGQGSEEEVVLVTTEMNQLVILSPNKDEILRTVDLPEPVTAAWADKHASLLATRSFILILSQDASTIIQTFVLPANVSPSSAIAVLPTTTSDTLHVLVASTVVVALHLELSSSKVKYTSSPLPASATSISSLHPLPLTEQGVSFLIVSEDDRTISQYTLPSPEATAKLSYRYASPTLYSAHSLAVESNLLAVLHESSEISLFHLPSTLDFARPKSDTSPSTVKLLEGKDERIAHLARVAFVPTNDGEPGSLLCGRMMGGGRLVWNRVVYESPEGGLKANTVLNVEAQDLLSSAAASSLSTHRYIVPNSIVVAPEDGDQALQSQLPEDVDMAELSLGERMLSNKETLNKSSVASNGKTAAGVDANFDGVVNAASLTRVLVQALHTSDPTLLTLCLSHRNPVLIRNTIRKMPTSLALPLLKACVERLGQGKGANKRGGGRGAGQNEQQGRGSVEWVKGVLIERGSILMTIPSLPVHLVSLSQLLQNRLELYQPLTSLSGRLDLALAQIAMRRMAAEQALAGDGQKGGEGEVYIEGESDDEVPLEIGGDEGEVEDVDMRGFSESSEESDDGDEGVTDEESEDPLESESGNEFLDLEADESGSEDEESDEDE